MRGTPPFSTLGPASIGGPGPAERDCRGSPIPTEPSDGVDNGRVAVDESGMSDTEPEKLVSPRSYGRDVSSCASCKPTCCLF